MVPDLHRRSFLTPALVGGLFVLLAKGDAALEEHRADDTDSPESVNGIQSSGDEGRREAATTA